MAIRTKKKNKTVITYGSFDLFHYGHLRLLERASELGDYLIVYVSSDEFCKLKNKPCSIPWKQRAEIVGGIYGVSYVFPEETWEQKEKDVLLWSKDDDVIFVMGDDWKGKFNDLPCEVVYLPRTKGISTTSIKEKIKRES